MSSGGALAIATPSMERPAQRQWSRVTFLDSIPPWVLESLRALDKIKELRDNWDGYGSPRIAPGAVTSAIKILASVEIQSLSAPQVSPVSGGGVGLHWRVGSRELELTVLPNDQVEYLKVLDQNLEREDAMQAGVLAAGRTVEVARMLTWLLTG